MPKLSMSESFIIRIYRVDTQDPHRVNGLVEAMDGSGERESFDSIDELGGILNRRALAAERQKRGRRFKAE